MKKFFAKTAALFAAAAFVLTGNVAYASEDASGGEPLVIDIPDAYFKIEVPDIYELVVDQKQEYRGKLAEYGLDASDTMGTMIANNTRFDAIYIPGDYAIEAFCNYDPANDNIIIKNLGSYSDDEVEDFSSEVALNASTSIDGMKVTSYEDGMYRDKNGIAYGCMKMEYTEDDATGSTTIGAYCMWTIVDGKTYYFYTKGYEPGVDGSVYKEETRALVDGVTYYNAPADAASKDDVAQQIIEEHISEAKDIDEILDKVKDSETTTNTTGKVQSDQEEQDVDDVIGNIYFQAGRVFAIIVVIMIIIGVIVAIISTNNAKKKRLNQQYYNGYNNGQNNYNNGYNNSNINGQNNYYNGQNNFNNGYNNGQNNYNNSYNNGNINGQNNFNNSYNNGNVNGQNNANLNGQNNYFNGNNNN